METTNKENRRKEEIKAKERRRTAGVKTG